MHTYRDKSEQSSLSQTENIKVGETRSSQREYDDNAQLARLGKKSVLKVSLQCHYLETSSRYLLITNPSCRGTLAS